MPAMCKNASNMFEYTNVLLHCITSDVRHYNFCIRYFGHYYAKKITHDYTMTINNEKLFLYYMQYVCIVVFCKIVVYMNYFLIKIRIFAD